MLAVGRSVMIQRAIQEAFPTEGAPLHVTDRVLPLRRSFVGSIIEARSALSGTDLFGITRHVAAVYALGVVGSLPNIC